MGAQEQGVHGSACRLLDRDTSPNRPTAVGRRGELLGQVNVNPGGSSGDEGFGAGMIVGIIVLILIVLVLVFYAGPQIINVNTNTRSLADLFFAA